MTRYEETAGQIYAIDETWGTRTLVGAARILTVETEREWVIRDRDGGLRCQIRASARSLDTGEEFDTGLPDAPITVGVFHPDTHEALMTRPAEPRGPTLATATLPPPSLYLNRSWKGLRFLVAAQSPGYASRPAYITLM
jgi:hypothetical protein